MVCEGVQDRMLFLEEHVCPGVRKGLLKIGQYIHKCRSRGGIEARVKNVTREVSNIYGINGPSLFGYPW